MKTPKQFRPMKAASSDGMDLSELRFPLYGTPKIDGIRCLMVKGRAMSSSLKPIPNRFIQKTLKGMIPFDGELAVGKNFQDCTSGIMSEDGRPDFTYYVFDQIPAIRDLPYLIRYGHAAANVKHSLEPRVRVLFLTELNNSRELKGYLKLMLKKGYEGAVVRSPESLYKCGRATWSEGTCIKFKPFADAEAKIIGFEEEYENTNTKTKNERGLSQRSGHQAGFKPKNTLGKFVVTAKPWGEFRVGTGQGLTQALRKYIWTHKKKYLGKALKFRYQVEGTKDKPRIPVAVGLRDPRDV